MPSGQRQVNICERDIRNRISGKPADRAGDISVKTGGMRTSDVRERDVTNRPGWWMSRAAAACTRLDPDGSGCAGHGNVTKGHAVNDSAVIRGNPETRLAASGNGDVIETDVGEVATSLGTELYGVVLGRQNLRIRDMNIRV